MSKYTSQSNDVRRTFVFVLIVVEPSSVFEQSAFVFEHRAAG